MNLPEHYNALYHDAIQKIKSDNYQIDNLIDSSSDNRFGITLLIRPDKQIRDAIRKFLSDLKIVEPDQYYYPDSDIHVTVMSIISCYNGFDVAQISVVDYVEIIRKSIINEKKMKIEFRGITASPSCILIQGFLEDDTLTTIRNNLRTNFKNSNLEQTLDKRYSIQTTHATVVRFKRALVRKEEFINVLDEYRDFNFGTFEVDSLELVYNDWYHSARHEKELYRFKIK
ncbi:MAG TPA: mutarotase [Cyclobacteriaceae bacterium]